MERLLRSLDFQPETVVDAAVVNSRLFIEAAEYRMLCRGKLDDAKMQLEQARAEKSLSIRHRASVVGDKITEGGIEAKLTVDPEIMALTTALRTAERHDEYSKMLVEAYRMRRDCVDIVSRFTRDEMNRRAIQQETESTLTDIRRKLKEKYPGRAATFHDDADSV